MSDIETSDISIENADPIDKKFEQFRVEMRAEAKADQLEQRSFLKECLALGFKSFQENKQPITPGNSQPDTDPINPKNPKGFRLEKKQGQRKQRKRKHSSSDSSEADEFSVRMNNKEMEEYMTWNQDNDPHSSADSETEVDYSEYENKYSEKGGKSIDQKCVDKVLAPNWGNENVLTKEHKTALGKIQVPGNCKFFKQT